MDEEVVEDKEFKRRIKEEVERDIERWEREAEGDIGMELGNSKTTEGKGWGDSKFAGNVSLKEVWKRFRRGEEKKKDKGKEREEFIIWEDVDRGVEGEGLVDQWKREKVVKEQGEKMERKKREKEGMVERSRERGLTREEILIALGELRDYENMVDNARYIFQRSREITMGYCLNSVLRRLERVALVGGGGKEVEGSMCGNLGSYKREGTVDIREKELEVVKVVEGGRSYKEVVEVAKPGMKKEDIKKWEKKKEIERSAEVRKGEEREKREVLSLEVVLDSQMEEGKDLSREEIEDALELEKGSVLKIEAKGERIRVIV